MAVSHFVYPFIHRWTFGFYFLAIMNNAAKNTHVHVSLWKYIFIYLGYIRRSRIASSYDNSVFNFWDPIDIKKKIERYYEQLDSN